MNGREKKGGLRSPVSDEARHRPGQQPGDFGLGIAVRPAVLFVRRDSDYKTMDCDVYDIDRDARTFRGGQSVVAHPPCRLWSTLRAFSTAPIEEKELAVLAVDQVRQWGGVLEHPINSTLWSHIPLPDRLDVDAWGGFTIPIAQWWFGHRAAKWTKLYICGCAPSRLPPMPFRLGDADRVVTNRSGLRSGMPGFKREVTKRERDATPPALAEWLLAVARMCGPGRNRRIPGISGSAVAVAAVHNA